MAHTGCPSGHDMWNGDGKPVVWAFRIGFFRKFAEEHPDCIMDDNSEYWQLYDCLEVQGYMTASGRDPVRAEIREVIGYSHLDFILNLHHPQMLVNGRLNI